MSPKTTVPGPGKLPCTTKPEREFGRTGPRVSLTNINRRRTSSTIERQAIGDYLKKAIESLAGAESELANRRFSNCANR